MTSWELIGLLLGGGALILAILTYRRAGRIEARIDRLARVDYHLQNDLDELARRNSAEIAALRLKLLKLNGEPPFTPEMTVGEALQLHPQAGMIMASWHLGGCASCAVDDGERLGEAAMRQGVDVAGLLRALNGLVDGKGAEQPARLPNVYFQL